MKYYSFYSEKSVSLYRHNGSTWEVLTNSGWEERPIPHLDVLTSMVPYWLQSGDLVEMDAPDGLVHVVSLGLSNTKTFCAQVSPVGSVSNPLKQVPVYLLKTLYLL